jgi:Na+/melibiose symporter-like transporter
LPPVQGGLLAAWLATMLVLVYTCHSLLQITHLAWGARLGGLPTVTRAAAWREGLGLAGVLGASVVPAWVLQPGAAQPQRGLAVYALGFAALLVVGLVLLLRAAPAWAGQRDDQAPAWREAWATPGFRALLLPYFLNALSVALPATLALFFIQDRIGAGAQAGWLLGLYFLAGAAGLPLWSRLAQRIGAAPAWRCGMVLSVLAFSTTVLLGPGDLLPYALVCAGAGLALGADLALPPVLLAARIPPGVQAAGYFGVWTLLGKLALAVSGLALPLLAVLGYTPGMAATSHGGWALALLYAGLPCVFKLAALVALSRGVITAPEENP